MDWMDFFNKDVLEISPREFRELLNLAIIIKIWIVFNRKRLCPTWSYYFLLFKVF